MLHHFGCGDFKGPGHPSGVKGSRAVLRKPLYGKGGAGVLESPPGVAGYSSAQQSVHLSTRHSGSLETGIQGKELDAGLEAAGMAVGKMVMLFRGPLLTAS